MVNSLLARNCELEMVSGPYCYTLTKQTNVKTVVLGHVRKDYNIP